MKTTIVCLLALMLSVSIASGQTKAVHFKKLQEFLPTTELKGFERKKPTGQTQTTMGMTTSEAKVRYVTKEAEQEVQDETETIQQSIEISISDMSGIPYGQMAAMAYQQDFENETENGYEKSVVVKKSFRGKESVESGDYKRCALEFAAGRFIIKMEASNTDSIAVLHKLAEGMNLAGLEKTTP